MSLKTLFKTDPNKEQSGIWVSLPQGEGTPDCEFLVAMMGPANKKFVAATQALQKKYKHALKTMSDQRQKELGLEAFVETVLLDWRNVAEYRMEKLVDGPCMMPFNRENAIFLLTDLPQIHEILAREATDFANFVAVSVDSDAKK